jgi:hypothetical protein
MDLRVIQIKKKEIENISKPSDLKGGKRCKIIKYNPDWSWMREEQNPQCILVPLYQQGIANFAREGDAHPNVAQQV